MPPKRVAQPPPGRDVVLSDFVADATNMVGRLVAVLWIEPNGGQTWYVGSVLQSNPADFSLTIKYGCDGSIGIIRLEDTIGEVRWLEGAPLPALSPGSASVSAAAAVRATLANPGQIVLLPAGGAFVGGKNSLFGPVSLHVGGLAAAVVTPSPGNIMNTTVTLRGIPGVEDLPVSLRSLLPNGAVDLDQLTPVTAEDVRVALDDPNSDLAVATLRVTAAHAHIKSVQAAAVAAANVQQDACVARVEAPGPDDDLSVPALHRSRPCEQYTPSHVSVLGPDHAARGEFESGDPPSHAAQAEAPCGRCRSH
jgi:hypothetical protein